MAGLNRFISRLGEWGLPFFKLLKRQDKFVWTEEAEERLCGNSKTSPLSH